MSPHPYVYHIIELPSPSPDLQPSTKISALLHPDLISMLPNPLPFATQIDPDPPYEVLNTLNKGAGVFARRPISKGSLILIDHPLFLVPDVLSELTYEIYEQMGRGLSEPQYNAMCTMANCRTKEESPSIVEGVLRTNAVNLQFPLPSNFAHHVKRYGGPFPTLNRTNHSCGPNAAHIWNQSNLSSTLYALRDINTGEEITHTYANPLKSREDRWKKLKPDYRFDCDCPWCTHKDPTSQAESDHHREYIQTYVSTYPSYRKWAKDLCLADNYVIDSHLAILPLLRKEGVDGLLPLFLEEIMRCYAELGEEELFRTYAEDTLRLVTIPIPALAQEIRKLLENPQKNFPTWGRRKKIRNQESKRLNQPRYDLDADDFSLTFLEVAAS